MSIPKSIAAKAVQNMEADHIFVFEKRIWNFSVRFKVQCSDTAGGAATRDINIIVYCY